MSELGPTLTSSDRTDLGDIDATDMRHDVATDVDEILEHVINGNTLSMPYSVYVELFDAVAELGVKVAKIETENAELRELAAGIGHLLFALDVDYCAACPRDGINHLCPVYTSNGGECLYKTDLRELGVEVD